MDADSYEKMKYQAGRSGQNWGEVKETLAWIRKGERKQHLSEFIYADREQH
jgi:hypothetical protein